MKSINSVVAYIVLLLCLNVERVFLKDVVVRSSAESIYSLKELLNSNTYYPEGLRLYIPDPYYQFGYSDLSSMATYVENSVSIISTCSNGTIFDYQKTKKGRFVFYFYYPGLRTVHIKGIIFQNYSANTANLIELLVKNDDYHFILEDCVFRNNNSNLLFVSLEDIKCTLDDPEFKQMEVINCRIEDTISGSFSLMGLNPQSSAYKNDIFPKCTTLSIVNTNFKNSGNVFFLVRGNLHVDNCIFDNIGSERLRKGEFIMSGNNNNHISINNSIFRNINLKKNLPLFYLNQANIEMHNITFTDIHSESTGLIYAERMDSNGNQMVITDSTFEGNDPLIYGFNNDITFKNCEFKNTTYVNNIPPIVTSTKSNIVMEDSTIQKINLLGSGYLLGEESTYTFKNVIMENITTNAISLITAFNKDIIFNGVTMKNIENFGDAGDSSIIYFNSEDRTRTIVIENSSIYNCNTNGETIRIKGSNAIVEIKNTTINDNISYGPFIGIEADISSSTFQNLEVQNNENLNKKSCGTINIKNDIDLSIDDSNFIDNKVASEGGAICLNNFSNIKFNLKGSSFEKNNGKYGGALYFDGNHSHNADNYHNEINFESVTFKENYASYFGGAIYTEDNELNSLKSANVIFNENQAGIAGGGVFIFSSSSDIHSIPYESFDFNNNKANSHGNDIGTSPSIIKLENGNNTVNEYDYQEYSFRSGSYFPLRFVLYDNFNNLIKDPDNYYSNVIIYISLQNVTKKYKLKGNVGSFSNGYCELNNLRIFTDPDDYMLQYNIDYSDNVVTFDVEPLQIKVEGCDDNQISRRDQDNILYCENPICLETCPVDSTAKCVSFDNNYRGINIAKLNKCVCDDGWEGPHCDQRIYVSFRKYNKIIYIMASPVIVLATYCLIHILIFRRQGIIKDEGIYKSIFFVIGVIMYFSSNYFSSHMSLLSCNLYFSLKHIGIVLIYYVVFVFIYSGSKIGVDKNFVLNSDNLKSTNTNRYSVIKASTNDFNNGSNTSINNVSNSNTKGYSVVKASSNNFNNGSNTSINNISNSNTKIYTSQNIKTDDSNATTIENLNKSSDIQKDIDKIMLKNINIIQSIYTEGLFISLLLTLTVMVVIITVTLGQRKEDDNINWEQDNTGEWIYMCPTFTYDIILNITEFLFLILLIIKVKKVWNYKYIFSLTRYLCYTVIVWVAIGPLVNVLSFYALSEYKFMSILFNTTLNYICYLFIFVMYFWNKFYYILFKRGGNDCNNYFIGERPYCLIHRTYTCKNEKCLKKTDPEAMMAISRSYIEYYSICSSILKFKDKKLRYYDSKLKLTYLNQSGLQNVVLSSDKTSVRNSVISSKTNSNIY